MNLYRLWIVMPGYLHHISFSSHSQSLNHIKRDLSQKRNSVSFSKSIWVFYRTSPVSSAFVVGIHLQLLTLYSNLLGRCLIPTGRRPLARTLWCLPPCRASGNRIPDLEKLRPTVNYGVKSHNEERNPQPDDTCNHPSGEELSPN